MRKKNKIPLWSIVMVLIMVCSILLPANQVFANNSNVIQEENEAVQYTIEKTSTEDELAAVSLSNDITDVDILNNSIIAAEDGKEITLTINVNIDVNKEIVIPRNKIVRFAGNGRLVRTTALDKKSHIIKIEEGAHLYLDGVTVDGNNIGERYQTSLRVASAIEVLGNFTMNSGNLIQHTCYVIHVSGANAQFTIEEGSIKNNNGSSGVFLEDHSTFIMNGGEISNNTFDNYTDMEVNTILVRNGSKFELNDGLIANNTHTESSGTIFVEGGRNGRDQDASSFVMNGGEISNNYSSGLSGGVTVGTWSNPDFETVASFEMNGGTIANNTSRYAGGGVLVIYNADFRMNAGQIINNQAPVGGGIAINDGFISSGAGDAGFTIEDWGTKYHCPASFTMYGGVVSGNSTNTPIQAADSEGYGGGIYIASNMVTFNAGTISNNTSHEQGGGIYVASVPYELQMYNTLITDNTASLLGGGIWTCPTGSVKILVNNGGALFDNVAQAEATGDDFISVPRGSNYTTTLSERMLGAGKVSYYRDGGVAADGVLGQPNLLIPRFDSNNPGDKIADISNSLEGYALKSVTDENAKDMARSEATVIVTGNKAKRGGGIGANGSVVIGTEDNKTYLSVKKEWNIISGDIPKSVTVDLIKIDGNNNKTVLETIKLSAENDWEYTFNDLPAQYSYEVKEHEIIGFEANYEKTQDGNKINIQITNSQEVVEKKITKVWADNNNQDGIRPSEVSVQLYADGKAIGDSTVLNEKNTWSATWSDLAKYKDGKEIVYSVKEVAVPDGYTDKVKIDKDGNFTLTNSHTPSPDKPVEPDKPTTPETPTNPEQPTNPNQPTLTAKPNTNAPLTGDTMNLGVLLVTLLGSSGLLLFGLAKRRKRNI